MKFDPNTNLPILEQKPANLRRTKIRVMPQMLPMLATILPAQIVGSEACEGGVCLVIEGVDLPESEFSTVMVERTSDLSVLVEIKALNG